MILAEHLADIEEIKQLKARYFFYLDHQNWNGWRTEVLAPDCEFYIPESTREPLRGSEAIINYVSALLEGVKTIHHGHMPQIAITSATTATGVWALEDILFWPPGKRPDGVHGRVHGYGHYQETYAKRNDGWRIKTLQLSRLHDLQAAGQPTPSHP